MTLLQVLNYKYRTYILLIDVEYKKTALKQDTMKWRDAVELSTANQALRVVQENGSYVVYIVDDMGNTIKQLANGSINLKPVINIDKYEDWEPLESDIEEY